MNAGSFSLLFGTQSKNMMEIKMFDRDIPGPLKFIFRELEGGIYQLGRKNIEQI